MVSPRGAGSKTLTGRKFYTLLRWRTESFIGTSSYCKSRFERYAECGEIISIYFLPECIGKGHGKKLLAAAVEKLAEMGFRDVFLWVLEENHNARAFYEHCGFFPSGEKTTSEIGGKVLTELRYCYHIEK